MEKFERYAEAVRSGKANQMGDSDVLIAPDPPQFIDIEPNNESRWPLIGAIAIVVIVVGVIAWLGFRKEIRQASEPLREVTRASFVQWARDIGIGLDCANMTVKNKRQVILHQCRFTTSVERARKQIQSL